jgi:hypothetical protein
MIQLDSVRIVVRIVTRSLLLLALTSLAACLDLEQAPEELGETSAALSATSASDRAQLALRWAPVHFQDVDQTGGNALGGAADYLAAYNFDGNLDGRDNWDHAGNSAFPLRAFGYYSVVETSSHWFLVYLFFHPRDWTDTSFDAEHENDAEGVMLVVRRNTTTFGQLRAAVTVAHTDFFSYVPAGGGWTSGGESVDGTLQMMTLGDGAHPVTAQEAKGHGLKARPDYDIVGDGVVYFPSLTTAEVPSHPDDRSVSYRLIDMLATGGLWDQRNNTSLFASFGTFAGDGSGTCGDGLPTCSSNSANASWGWDDQNDGPTRGALARDPAGLARAYFTIPEAISTTYTFNPFR